MQGTADFHEQIADTRLPQAARVVDNAAALDAAVDVLDARPPTGDAPMRGVLLARKRPAPRLLRRHDDVDLRECEGQTAQILEPPAARRHGIRGGLGNPLIMGTAGIGLTQQQDRQGRVDQQHVFDGGVLFLAAITARLLSRILGALEAPCRPIVPKRGETVAGASAGGAVGGEGSAAGTTREAALASATPRRWANACTDRVGASPNARSVARRTTKRT